MECYRALEVVLDAVKERNWGKVLDMMREEDVDFEATACFRQGFPDKVSLLHCLAGEGDAEGVEFLVQQCRVDPNTKSKFGRTPLMSAVVGGHVEVVRFLMEGAGCDGNVGDRFGRRAVHLAASKGEATVLSYLAHEAGVDLEVVDGNGERPLHHAAKEEGGATLAMLLQCGVDVDAANPKGETALHIAACYGRLDCVRLLVEADANVLLKEAGGLLASDLCEDIDAFRSFDEGEDIAACKRFLQEVVEMAQMRKSA